MSERFTALMDAASQMLTTAPFWLQLSLVLCLIVPFFSVVALVWLRLVDVAGALVLRAIARWID